MSGLCKGKYHGSVPKELPEGEKLCLLCKAYIDAQKRERNENIKKTLVEVGKAVPVIIPVVRGLVALVAKNKKKA